MKGMKKHVLEIPALTCPLVHGTGTSDNHLDSQSGNMSMPTRVPTSSHSQANGLVNEHSSKLL